MQNLMLLLLARLRFWHFRLGWSLCWAISTLAPPWKYSRSPSTAIVWSFSSESGVERISRIPDQVPIYLVIFSHFSLDPNPATRHTVFSVVVGGFFYWTSLLCTNQASVQKCMSLRCQNKANKALTFSIIGRTNSHTAIQPHVISSAHMFANKFASLRASRIGVDIHRKLLYGPHAFHRVQRLQSIQLRRNWRQRRTVAVLHHGSLQRIPIC